VTALAAPIICLVTDRRRLSPDARTDRDARLALLQQCEDACAAGVTTIQVRERDLDGGALAEITRTILRLASGTRAIVLVNDRADVALATDAGGVHLRSDSLGTMAARALGAGDWMVGRSVHDCGEVAREPDADYLLFGTVFATGSKPGRAVHGAAGLAAAVRSARSPVIAIGGITPARAAEAARVGAAGVAGISIFFPPSRGAGALGAGPAVAALRDAFDHGRSGHVQ
jgi:thiamine-phosphate diphosphorylase